jgi:glycosyltransferase involved in cell wall biosynthesis
LAPLTLSIVVPVYNEAGTVGRLVADLEREVVPVVPACELVVVDDASTDGSGQLLDELASSRPWLRVLHAERNAGHGPSVVAGLERASGAWVFQLDSDGQFLVAEFARLWERREEADLLLGVRVARNDPLHRRLLSRAAAAAVSRLARRSVLDPNTPFRLLRREVWADLEPAIGRSALAPSIYVTLGAVHRGWRVVDVPVTHLARETGVSTLRSWRLLSFAARGLRELVAYRRSLSALPPPVPRAGGVAAERTG